jgi:hypothetical protein
MRFTSSIAPSFASSFVFSLLTAALVGCGGEPPILSGQPGDAGPEVPSDTAPEVASEGGADVPLPSPGCITADLVVRSAADAKVLASAPCIVGSLTIDTTEDIGAPSLREVSRDVIVTRAPATVVFPRLATIRGALSISASSSLSFPVLAVVGGSFALRGAKGSFSAPDLAVTGPFEVSNASFPSGLSFPALATIEGDVLLSNSRAPSYRFPRLRRLAGALSAFNLLDADTLEAPALREITGHTTFVNSGPLRALAFPALVRARNFVIDAKNELRSVSLPLLATAAFVSIDAPALHTLDVPSLAETSSLHVGSEVLTELSLPALKRVTSNFILRDSPLLSSVRAPALEEVGNVLFSDLPSLAAVNFDAVHTVNGALSFKAAPRLVRLSFPSLRKVFSLRLHTNAQLTELSVPSLLSAGSDITVHDTPLSTISFPSLVEAGSLWIANDSSLVDVEFPLLRKLASGGSVRDCPKLPVCRIDAINARLTVDGKIFTSGLATCPTL